MGIDATATLAYGVKIINKKLIDSLCNEDIDLPEGFCLQLAGSGCDDDTVFVSLKESEISFYHEDDYDSPIKQEKLIAKPDWNSSVLELCEVLKIKKPKIGWWLLASMC
ncbi:hypothetical protein UFOVP1290_447 [uncultured Caudovirales phage]|uniref:Uncharacterized protein n=1 Tax=uncultured Caudovirales phage TaxID=2100421 RepID=A0A6J5RRL7_9CAUD|nr:hypothetical protein UFOVP1290_447 [uncultured Caudovirales phage]